MADGDIFGLYVNWTTTKTQVIGSDSGSAAINVHPMDCSVNLSVHQVGKDENDEDKIKSGDTFSLSLSLFHNL